MYIYIYIHIYRYTQTERERERERETETERERERERASERESPLNPQPGITSCARSPKHHLDQFLRMKCWSLSAYREI